MRNVDEHAHPIHLPDEFASLRAHAAPSSLRLPERILQDCGVGELVVAVVSEGGISHSEVVIQPEVGDRVPDLMEALDPEGRDELTILESG